MRRRGFITKIWHSVDALFGTTFVETVARYEHIHPTLTVHVLSRPAMHFDMLCTILVSAISGSF